MALGKLLRKILGKHLGVEYAIEAFAVFCEVKQVYFERCVSLYACEFQVWQWHSTVESRIT